MRPAGRCRVEAQERAGKGGFMARSHNARKTQRKRALKAGRDKRLEKKIERELRAGEMA